MGHVWLGLAVLVSPAADSRADPAVEALAGEVADRGWIAYAARSKEQDWDLFLCRPDGSQVRNITRTPAYHEFAPQFSRDGGRVLYRRMPRSETLDNNHYGTQGELVLANSDGTDPRAWGGTGAYPWASWSPDGRTIATLSIKGIDFVDLAEKRVVRKLDRKGFFQQVTWSPDGRWLCGVANSFGTSWSVARMEVATGKVEAVHRVDCCTPDWFPDSKALIFSWRPPGQKGNSGYGWTQLWMADAEGKSRRLVYGEEGRHVYGGHVSPDGRYVLFTGNMHEDGDPGRAGAPMALMRLCDTPLIGGASPELRALHPQAGSGPVLALPMGWEPCWTYADIPSGLTGHGPAETQALAKELHGRGWIAFSATSAAGDWDLFACRPDGTGRRALTTTPEFHEAGVRFSPDGRRILYYRLPTSESLDNNTYGTYELLVADCGGAHAEVLGRDYRWASWGPDGTQIACLAGGSIRIVDLAARRTVRELPRRGMVQQLAWSPDGRWFTGTANGLGPYWNVARLHAETGAVHAVSETDRYNCTPDWLPDSERIVYSRGIVPEQGGFAEIWIATGDGRQRQAACVDANRHLYGGCVSPDGRYLLFTRSESDLGPVEPSHTRMSIIRLQDAPVVLGDSPAIRRRFPSARSGPHLDLSWGWEPHWTHRDPATASSTGGEPRR